MTSPWIFTGPLHRHRVAPAAESAGWKEARLERFLFGAERAPTQAVRRAEVDHFVPWTRHPNNAIENLVVSQGAL